MVWPELNVDFNIVKGDDEKGSYVMRRLTWRPILHNLVEACRELRTLHARLHYLQFGELPEESFLKDADSQMAWLDRQEDRHPFNEVTLFIRMEHAYHHLNWAWNCRRTLEERVWNFSTRAFDKWMRFPTATVFADLWPRETSGKKNSAEVRMGKVNLTTVRLNINMALRKLEILCYLVAKELGENVSRPKGLKAEVGSMSLTEGEYARRLHSIYAMLNLAWNSRRDKTFVVTKSAVERRRCFSPIFATGCYNMWR